MPPPPVTTPNSCYTSFSSPTHLLSRDRKRPCTSAPSDHPEIPIKRRASVDEGDDIVISDDEEAAGTNSIKAEPAFAVVNSHHNATDIMYPFSLSAKDSSTQNSLVSPASAPFIPDLDPDFDVSWVTNEFVAGSKKAHVILNAERGEDFDEVTKKILDSLLYDLGKAAAVKYLPEANPDDKFTSKLHTRRFIDCLFEVWCANFQHMANLETMELNFTPEKKMSFKIYMRARISNAFSSVRRAKSKQSQR